MWNEFCTQESFSVIVQLGNDEHIVKQFFKLLETTSPTEIKDLIKKWSSLTELEQAKVSISKVGEYHCSRFMMLMDYLLYKDELNEDN